MPEKQAVSASRRSAAFTLATPVKPRCWLRRHAAKKAAESQVAYGGTTDGKTIFGNLCQTCHTNAATGAPVISDKARLGAARGQGPDTLVDHAINGYQGPDGKVMPAKGGNPSLTNEQVKATVEWMVSQVK